MRAILIFTILFIPWVGFAQDDAVYEIFDVSKKAEFSGGEEGLQRFLAENIVFPEQALMNDVQGSVNLVFIVNKEGRVENIQILGNRIGYGLEDEAIRVLKLTSGMWKPAFQKDKAVNMRLRLPIKFTIYHNKPVERIRGLLRKK